MAEENKFEQLKSKIEEDFQLADVLNNRAVPSQFTADALNQLLFNLRDANGRIRPVLEKNEITKEQETELKRTLYTRLEYAFASWWFDPNTTVEQRLTVLKDEKLDPFFNPHAPKKEENNENDKPKDSIDKVKLELAEKNRKDFEREQSAMLSIIHTTLVNTLWGYYPALTNSAVGRKTHDLLQLSDLVLKAKTKPYSPEIGQQKHLTYAIALTTLGYFETTQENAKKIIEYSMKISGSPTNVKFNKTLGRVLFGIGLGLFAAALITFMILGFTLPPTDAIVGGVLLPILFVGFASVLGFGIPAAYFYNKSQTRGISRATNLVGKSIFASAPKDTTKSDDAKDGKSKNNTNDGYAALHNDPDKEKSLAQRSTDYQRNFLPRMIMTR